jgi:hypothetical protein
MNQMPHNKLRKIQNKITMLEYEIRTIKQVQQQLYEAKKVGNALKVNRPRVTPRKILMLLSAIVSAASMVGAATAVVPGLAIFSNLFVRIFMSIAINVPALNELRNEVQHNKKLKDIIDKIDPNALKMNMLDFLTKFQEAIDAKTLTPEEIEYLKVAIGNSKDFQNAIKQADKQTKQQSTAQ